MILDSCHSASSTRSSGEKKIPGLLTRGFKLPDDYQPLLSIDKNILQQAPDGGSRAALGPGSSGLASHVLLAACSSGGTANELDGRGQFTQALLQALRCTSTQKITYRELMKRVVVKECVDLA